MSDLISRSEVNDVIDELEVYTSGRPNTMKVEISVLQLQRFIKKLKNIPTAYSIDKIVEELEKVKTINIDVGYGTIYKTIRKDSVIEIVKQGGVADDVCEHRLIKGYKFLHETRCGNMFDMQNDFKYCPYCGKKIKKVK